MNRLNFCSVVKSDVSYRQTPFQNYIVVHKNEIKTSYVFEEQKRPVEMKFHMLYICVLSRLTMGLFFDFLLNVATYLYRTERYDKEQAATVSHEQIENWIDDGKDEMAVQSLLGSSESRKPFSDKGQK